MDCSDDVGSETRGGFVSVLVQGALVSIGVSASILLLLSGVGASCLIGWI